MSTSCWTVVGAGAQAPPGTCGAGGTKGAEARDQVVPSGDRQRSRPMPAGVLSVQPTPVTATRLDPTWSRPAITPWPLPVGDETGSQLTPSAEANISGVSP